MPSRTGSTELLSRFGFSSEVGGAHLARTMMVDELWRLLAAHPSGHLDDYLVAVVDENALGKPSHRSRQLTARHLKALYGLDASLTLFRALRFLLEREPSGRGLTCLLVAYARDAVLRASAPYVLGLAEGDRFERGDLESFLGQLWPERFSPATLKSTAQNLGGTWTQSGHLVGHVKKTRRPVSATVSATVMALLLGRLRGERGELLFETDYIKLLDCSAAEAMDLAESAARKGLITLKRVGSVVEVDFPRLMTPEEVELLREQN